jgi:hypothetical protein
MGLQADLSSHLDASALVTTFLSGVNTSSGQLNNVSVPANTDQLSQAQQQATAVDTSIVGPAIQQVMNGLPSLLQVLPGADEVLGPVTTSLGLIESTLIATNLPQQMETLSAKLGDVLKGPRDEGFIGVLMQFADMLASAPEKQALSSLLEQLFEAAGTSPPSTAVDAVDIASAVRGAVMTLGGLISLETTLAEAEQLTTLMQAQLDSAEVNKRKDELVACLSGNGVSLSQFVRTINVNNAAEVHAARSAIANCATRLRALVDFVSKGSAFGEATLLYLDLPRLQESVNHSAGMVREADLDPLERLLRSLQTAIAPFVNVDLAGTPSFSLEDLLTSIEARVGDIASGISSFDLTQFTDPLTAGIGEITALPRMLDAAISQVVLNIQSALGQLRDAITALPIQSIGNVIRQILQPLVQALEFISALVDAIKKALDEAVKALQQALNTAEGVVDSFKQEIENLFGAAAEFIDTLHLDRVLAEVTDNVNALVTALEQAQMKPYFDTAVDAIDVATTVVENVPFSLLPDSMEQEVADAIRPVKTVDLNSFKGQIEGLLQIGPDGKFQLRPNLEEAVAGIQEKYVQLIEELRTFDPHLIVDQIDQELKNLADKIAAISPQVELQPVQDAIDHLRDTVAAFDLNAELKPLRDAFDDLINEAEKYSPAQLITPLETRLDAARNELIRIAKLREANESLETITAAANALIARLDPAQLEPQIEASLKDAQKLLDQFPQFQFAGGWGALVTSLLAGIGLRVNPLAFETVLTWLQGTPGAAALTTRSAHLAQAISSTRTAVAAFDPAELVATLSTPMQALAAAVAALPAGTARESLQAELDQLDVNVSLGALAGNRTRYLQRLTEAEAVARNLSGTGLSEVDIKIDRLSASFAPLQPIRNLINEILQHLGITGLDQGLGEVFRRVFAVASPKRLAEMMGPIYAALRTRLLDLINAVINPIKQGITDLLAAVDRLDLTPLREEVDSVFQAAIGQIRNLHPDVLLGSVLTAFNDAKTNVANFNPLVEIETALTALRESTVRILGKLNASEILATPIQIYENVLGLFAQLDLTALLAPLYQLLDDIAKQVHEGLTETVDSFSRLQDALPDSVGSTSVAASVSVG